MAFAAPAQYLTLPDQRVLAYAIYGAPEANATVFYHHGFPASRDEALVYHEAAQRHDVRLITADRPGMGSSTQQAHRRLLDWPSDLLALADHLTIDRFAILGVSGGAPYVFACWDQLPRARCVGAGVVSGLYPANLGLEGMMLGSRVLLYAGRWSPWLVGKGLEWGLGAAARDTQHPETFDKLLDDTFRSRPTPDRDAWAADRNHAQLAMKRSLQGCFESGGQGAGWEAGLFGSDWGFELGQLSVVPGKMLLWHGSEDVNCPLRMAERAAGLMTGAELRVVDGEGHFSLIMNRAEEVMESLAQMLFTE